MCTNKYKYCEYAGVEYSKQVAAQCPQHDYDHEEDNSFEYRKDEILSIMVCGDNQQPLCHMSWRTALKVKILSVWLLIGWSEVIISSWE